MIFLDDLDHQFVSQGMRLALQAFIIDEGIIKRDARSNKSRRWKSDFYVTMTGALQITPVYINHSVITVPDFFPKKSKRNRFY